MGLDMYLTKKIVKTVEKGNEEHIYVDQADVMYWRKANAIHKWFVDNVQNGIDDCKQYEVSIEQLKELIELCKKISEKQNQEIASVLLPTQDGFFFGGTDYDAYYFDEIKRTYEELEQKILGVEIFGIERPDEELKTHYYYQSSW